MAVFANLGDLRKDLRVTVYQVFSIKEFAKAKTECSLRVKSINIGYRILYLLGTACCQLH